MGWSGSRSAWVRMAAAATVAAVGAGGAHAQLPEVQFERQVFLTADPASPRLPSVEQLQSVKIDPEVRAAVQQLDDPSFKAREHATKTLLDDQTDNMQLQAMLAGKDLTCEQRYRLLAVLEEKLVNVPRGALGISTDLIQIQRAQRNVFAAIEGVRITELLPGLPAERVLQVDDWITHIDGTALTQMGQLQKMVQSKRPGERVVLTVRRAKVDANGHTILDDNGEAILEELQIPIELGSAAALEAFGGRFGQNGRPSDVERGRRDLADAAYKRYGPAPRSIAVRGGAGALYAATTRQPGIDSFENELEDEEQLIADVERHPAIQALRADLDQILLDGRATTPQDFEKWKRRLGKLTEQVEDVELTFEQHKYLQRVIERFMELLQE